MRSAYDAGGEGGGTHGAESLEGVGQIGGTQHLAGAHQTALAGRTPLERPVLASVCPPGCRGGSPAGERRRAPARARRTAGASTRDKGNRPWRSCSVARPSAAPGTAHEAGPTWNTWVVERNGTSYGSMCALAAMSPGVRPRPGALTKKSSTSAAPSGRRTRAKPPPPNPVRHASAHIAAATAPTAASAALPPTRRISAPARVVAG